MTVMVARPQYNSRHKARRTRAIAALIPGSPCPRCGEPMYATPRAALEAGLPAAYGTLHLDHIQPVMLGGADGPVQLTHARCNTSAGGYLGAVVTNARNGNPVGSSPRRRRSRTRGGYPSPGEAYPAGYRPQKYDRW
jgi:hypothetical protein